MIRSSLILLIVVAGLLASPRLCLGLGEERFITNKPSAGGFAIVQDKAAARILVDSADHAGVIRAAKDLQKDIARVTGVTPELAQDEENVGPAAILIGTIGKNKLIDRLIADGKVDASGVAGKWEASVTQVVNDALPGVSSALVIAGSDKRGTIYGIYDLSAQVGVSPWYWWADVPLRRSENLFVKPGRYVRGEPAVKYRGIFINDENPAMLGWANEKFGGFNHKMYAHVFELILRLRGNYLWPAMWGKAFNEDDPANPRLADEYGIVMGTSHHEPMLRAQKEWRTHGKGPWNYATNDKALKEFWRFGVERNKDYESIVTIGMRGDGDEPMVQGGDMTANVALLERIVEDQRKLIAQSINPDVTKVPQLWALYKEVQEYYEKGMRVPDDVTLLWCDDNWGNIRRLPTPEERKRSGGAGVYYHLDYVGGPRSYKWINTVPIPKIWEQMNFAHEYGANRIWIVNVGDLKPMEFATEFFLRMAYDPNRWPKEKLAEFGRLWAQREFGPQHADQIADIIAKYTKYNGRRKPELLAPDTFSLVNYNEAERVLEDWRAIVTAAEQIEQKLPAEARDAFYQLVLYPAKASATVTELWITAGRNGLFASQGRAAANDLAARARELFRADADLTERYHQLGGGRWNHMMSQPRIGYTSWQQPDENVMPEVKQIELPQQASMGVAVEGSTSAWPGGEGEPKLPPFDPFNRPRRWIDVFNRGSEPFEFTATPSAPWIKLSESRGPVDKERRLWVEVDWDKAPPRSTDADVRLGRGDAEAVTVKVRLSSPSIPSTSALAGFVQADGHVSIEAEHYTRKIDGAAARWEKIPDLGRTGSSMSVFPVTARSMLPPQTEPRLEYDVHLFDKGDIDVEVILGPTLNFVPGRGLRFAISFDDEPPRIVDALEKNSLKDWEATVRDAVRKVTTKHTLPHDGPHTLKIWMVDPGIVLQKLVVGGGGVRPSCLGPPQSYRAVPPAKDVAEAKPAPNPPPGRGRRPQAKQRSWRRVARDTRWRRLTTLSRTGIPCPREWRPTRSARLVVVVASQAESDEVLT